MRLPNAQGGYDRRVKNGVVCFVNRSFGRAIVHLLADDPSLRIDSVIVHPEAIKEWELSDIAGAVPVMDWESFLALSRSNDIGFSYGLCALFGYRLPSDLIRRFAHGIVNLHPSLLPFGRGKHPATWAIWEQTPYGVSAHLVSEAIDSGPILDQVEVEVFPWDTSHSLYARAMGYLYSLAESSVVPWLHGDPVEFTPQASDHAYHSAKDLMELRQYATSSTLNLEDHIRLIRALTLAPGEGIHMRQGKDNVEVCLHLRRSMSNSKEW